ncbi:uncharacterized protein LOC106154794 isoform X3 [Lingula anatina]|uniref:Uncharacterized protein LOC106154794 isoform X3 n=1 Tax=Lingula anatina TaxID=7574 RepID=A0A1S3HF87_LINAN|nr:uncharacterized protein LOC106154794 isoform X3 [Lingula anatina]|eukprot:XP_013384737.1 uncharacterized protein LOC106154794 isoform X3 [Lingula anatina]
MNEDEEQVTAEAGTSATGVNKFGECPSRPDFLDIPTQCAVKRDGIQASNVSTDPGGSQLADLEDHAILLEDMEDSQNVLNMTNEDILLDAGYDQSISKLPSATLNNNSLDPDSNKVKVTRVIDHDGMLLDEGAHNIRRNSDTLPSRLSSSCTFTSKWSDSTQEAVKYPQVERQWSLDHNFLVTQNWATFREGDLPAGGSRCHPQQEGLYHSSPRSMSMLEYFSSSPSDSSLKECWAYPRVKMSSSANYLRSEIQKIAADSTTQDGKLVHKLEKDCQPFEKQSIELDQEQGEGHSVQQSSSVFSQENIPVKVEGQVQGHIVPGEGEGQGNNQESISSSTQVAPNLHITNSNETIGTKTEVDGAICDSDETPIDTVKPMSISDLPVEIMHHILSYLTPRELCRYVSPVCRQWHALSRDPALWKVLQFEYSDQISTESLCICFQYATLLRHLSLHGRQQLNYAEIKALADSCSHLHTINLGFCDSVNYGIIATLVRGCRELEVVNVEGCTLIDHQCIQKLCELPSLCSVNLSHCTGLQDDSIEHMARNIKSLFSLNIDGISWVTDDAISVLVSHQGQHLRQLCVDGAELSDDSLAEISKCKLLEKFSISFAELVTDVGVQHLKKLSNLTSLRLKKGNQLTNDGIKCLFGGEELSNLHLLDLTECSELEDDGVQQLVECCGSSLEYLALCWCWNITDHGLASIVDKCSHLQFMDLLGLDKIQGISLERIPGCLPHLKFMDLRQCGAIEDELIVGVIKKKPDLVAVNYYGEEFSSEARWDLC